MTNICVVNKKGGVSKTTTAINLGAALRNKGLSILFVDLDSQCNLSVCAEANIDGKNALGVLMEQIDINDSIQCTPFGDVLPAGLALSGADGVITDTGKEYRLKEALGNLKKNYDFCIIDTPPSIGVLTINAMTAADWLVIPAQADVFSRDGLLQLDRAIKQDKKYCNPKLKIAGILLTRYSARNILSKNLRETFEEIALKMGTRVFASNIREGIAIKEAQVVHKTIFDYAPKSNVAKDYINFTEEFCKVIKVLRGNRNG